MEEMFNNLQKAAKNNVDELVKWIQEAKLVEASKEGQEKARALFADVTDKNKVELSKFKQVLSELAKEQNKTVAQLSEKLATEAPNVQEAIKSGVNAVKNALNLGK